MTLIRWEEQTLTVRNYPAGWYSLTEAEQAEAMQDKSLIRGEYRIGIQEPLSDSLSQLDPNWQGGVWVVPVHPSESQWDASSFDPLSLWVTGRYGVLNYRRQNAHRVANESAETLWMQMKGQMLVRDHYLSDLLFSEEEALAFAETVLGTMQRMWGICEECNLLDTGLAHDHPVCNNCDAVYRSTNSRTLNYYTYNGNTAQLTWCNPCTTRLLNTPDLNDGLDAEFPEWTRCEVCSAVQPNDEAHRTSYGGAICGRCVTHDGYEECPLCESLSNTFEDDECIDCFRANNNLRTYNSWDWRPDLVFHPEVPDDPKKPLYIGMELETSFNYDDSRLGPRGLATQRWLGELPEDLIYAKGDSSVENGFEIVTHPFQPRWGLDNLPFDSFQELIDNLGARPTHRSCGTHIHMNKEAFSNTHLWKFLQIHYRMASFCQLVGGRQDNDFASFSHGDVGLQRERLMEIVKQKDKAISDYNRYCAVNLRNEYTIELRYMRGGINPSEIKKNIYWALALYEFSDYLKISDINEGALDDPGFMLWWINNHDYPELQQWLEERVTTAKPLKERN